MYTLLEKINALRICLVLIEAEMDWFDNFANDRARVDLLHSINFANQMCRGEFRIFRCRELEVKSFEIQRAITALFTETAEPSTNVLSNVIQDFEKIANIISRQCDLVTLEHPESGDLAFHFNSLDIQPFASLAMKSIYESWIRVRAHSQNITTAARAQAEEEQVGASVVAGGAPAPVLEAGKCVFDPVALTVEDGVVQDRNFRNFRDGMHG